mmetsp:Transcript_66819/g.195378  ORF Transcript_66819/g.195378 Transcript_66819/m.195378 type:complete len:313 (+) Transcript_66819:115-1053(+)
MALAMDLGQLAGSLLVFLRHTVALAWHLFTNCTDQAKLPLGMASLLTRPPTLPAAVEQLPHPQLHGLDFPRQALSDVDDLLHLRRIRVTELQHGLNELIEGEGRLVVKDEVCIVNERQHVHADIRQDLAGQGLPNQHLELCWGDLLVAILVDLGNRLLDLQLDVAGEHDLILGPRDFAHNVANHADEEVHDRQAREAQIDDRDDVEDGPCVQRAITQVRLVWEDAPLEQAIHGLGHVLEASLLHVGLALLKQLSEQDGKDVDEDEQQHHRRAHGARRRHHCLCQDHQLWELMQEPQNPAGAQEAEQPKGTED